MSKQVNANIRDAQPKDNYAIAAIFNQEVETTSNVLELRKRTSLEQRKWLKSHSGVYSVLVLEDGNDIAGYACISQYRSRAAYTTTAESSVFIDEVHRGKGYGSQLLNSIIERARQNGFHGLIARIVASNEASVKLHEACGFDFIGVEKEVARKFGKWLDCAVFQKLL